MLVELYHSAGVPDDLVRLIVGGPDEGRALTAHEHVDGVLFTGSAQTGIAINTQLAAHPDKILALEMGGNNPIVVWDTADVHTAAVVVVQSAFISAGQRCTAAKRLIVKDSLYDALMDQVKKRDERQSVGEKQKPTQPVMMQV